MKSLVVALTLLAGAYAQADCQVQSKLYPELERGINAETICREVVNAIDEQSSVKAADYDVVVSANGERGQFNVALVVELKQAGKAKYSVPAMLYWYPGGDTYVYLNEKSAGKAADLKGPINEIINK